jgi:hypothetical protein
MATTFRDADRPRTCKLAQRCNGIREPVGKPGRRRLIGRWPNQSQRLKRAARADRLSQRNFEILWMVFCGSGGLFCFLAGCWSLGRLRMPNAPLIDWLMQRPSPGSANFTNICVLSDLGRAGAHLRTRHHVHLKNTFKLPNFLPFPLSPPPFYPTPGTPSSTLAHSPFRVFIFTSFIQWIPHSPLHRRRLVFWFSPSPSPSYPRSNNNAPACPSFLFIYPIPQLRLPGDSRQFHRCRSAAINCLLPRKCCSVSPTSLIDRRLPLQSTTGQDRNASTLA